MICNLFASCKTIWSTYTTEMVLQLRISIRLSLIHMPAESANLRNINSQALSCLWVLDSEKLTHLYCHIFQASLLFSPKIHMFPGRSSSHRESLWRNLRRRKPLACNYSLTTRYLLSFPSRLPTMKEGAYARAFLQVVCRLSGAWSYQFVTLSKQRQRQQQWSLCEVL